MALWAMPHIPVMIHEVLAALAPRDGDRVLDCTFGGGGHSRAILDSAECYVCGVDRDPDALERAAQLDQQYHDRFDFMLCQFSNMGEHLRGHRKFDAALFDFGVSSFQIDNASRGFSFMNDATLDMRMSKAGLSAFDVVNSFEEGDIAEIIYTYGEESLAVAKRIAASIIKERMTKAIKTTGELRRVVHSAIGTGIPARKKHSTLDVATKTFQAIRIFVNDELGEINVALKTIPQLLNDNARIATIAFHSLEDRIVKNWAASMKPQITAINKNVICPSRAEISENPRSRSAKLRGFIYHGSSVSDDDTGVRSGGQKFE